MKKISILILIFLFLGNLALFSQDGEEIDFLEKVTEPKKTVSKKSSNTAGASSGTSTPKKRKRKDPKRKDLKIFFFHSKQSGRNPKEKCNT